ncbi:hypothetical protein BCEN4_660014 [Burkholderia cenocepacia]|nr:hypothetical protein BCEN4_660014 [Burkholderia cenocepacia]
MRPPVPALPGRRRLLHRPAHPRARSDARRRRVIAQRRGFSSAVLGDDTDLAAARRQLDRFQGFHQRDARTVMPPQEAPAQPGK